MPYNADGGKSQNQGAWNKGSDSPMKSAAVVLLTLPGQGHAADRVVFLEVDQTDSLGGPAGRPDLPGFDPDDLPRNRDDQEVIFPDAQNGDGFADLGCDLEVDEALPAAPLAA